MSSMTFSLSPSPCVLYLNAPSTLSLAWTNTSGRDLTLRAGAPIAEGDAAATTTLLYLSFGTLVQEAQWHDAVITADGWTTQFLPPTDSLSTGQWCLCPQDRDITFTNGSTITFTLGNVVAVGSARLAGGALSIDVHNVWLDEHTAVSRPFTCGAISQNAPHATPKPLPVTIEWLEPDAWSTRYVYTTTADTAGGEVVNQLQFKIQNTSPGPVGHGAGGGEFTVAFVYTDDPTIGGGALTTTQLGNRITLSAAPTSPGQVPWDPPQEQPGNSWTLTPTSAAILVAGQALTVIADTIIVPFDVDAAGAPTVMFVSWTGVPGYDDGAVMLDITIRRGPHLVGATNGLTFTQDAPVDAGVTTATTITSNWQGVDHATVDIDGVPRRLDQSKASDPYDLTGGEALDVTLYPNADESKASLSTRTTVPQNDAAPLHLLPDTFLQTYRHLQSPNGQYLLWMQDDSNLTVADQAGSFVWGSVQAGGRPAQPTGRFFAFLRGRTASQAHPLNAAPLGSLGVYEGNDPTDPTSLHRMMWKAPIDLPAVLDAQQHLQPLHDPNAYFVQLENDGNLVLYTGDPDDMPSANSVWSSRPPVLLTNQSMLNDSPMFSPNGRWKAILQSDGNLCIRPYPFVSGGWCALGVSCTAPPPYTLTMSGTGSLFVSTGPPDAPQVPWKTPDDAAAISFRKQDPSIVPDYFAALGDDGTLVVRRGTPDQPWETLWRSPTPSP